MRRAKAQGRSRRLRRSSLPLLLALLLVPAWLETGRSPASAQTPSFNYAEALQKAIWFYEAQISGPKPSFSRVSWRGDSALQDGADHGHDLTGGWFDAGDHVKFGYAMASSATMLAWSGVEYRAAFDAKGQLTPLLNNLRWVNDYFIKAHTAPNELWGQVGDPGPDHAFWGSAEVMHLKTSRVSFKIDMTCGGSDLAAETAAAMAASSIVFRDAGDTAYANTLLGHARQLFSFAQATHPSWYVDCMPGAPYYDSHAGGNTPRDEMAWAAVWLHKATGEAGFLTTARQHYATMCKESDGTTPCFTWTQSWNDKHFGTYVLMAKLTGEAPFHADAQRWLDYWTVGAGRQSRTTAGGLMFVHNFGSLRYATNTAFIALVYADFLGQQNALFARYHDFAKRQVDYVLGANPRNASYMCGFGNNPPRNPHHRTAHGTWTNNPTGEPNPSRHTFFGAMVAGPDAQDDFAWSDERNSFMRTEPATDMNAGLTGALARLAQEFGGNPLPSFPPTETPDDEIFIDARIQDNQPNFTTIQAFIRNRSAWPTRILTGGSFRYYFNLEPGISPGQLQLQTFTSECGGNVLSGPTQFSGNTFFVTVNCPGAIAPTGESDHRREVQFRITAPNTAGSWDPTNDYSFQGLTSQLSHTRRIVIFQNGTPIWGQEPGPPTPDFSLSASPLSVTVNRGSTAASTLTVTPSGGFASAVALSVSSLPAGVTASFNPASTTGTSTLTFTAAANATLGTSNVTVTGSGGGLTHTASITLVVNQPDFSLSASPANVTVNQAGTASSTINIARTGGFTGAVSLSASGLPAGVTAAFNPVSATGASSALTFTASATATTGPATVTVTGASGAISRITTINLTVNPAATPDFALAAAPASVALIQGSTATSTIGVTRLNGFTGAVALSASGLPTGVTAGFNPASVTGTSSILTFTASATATTGPATVTVTGTSGTLTHAVSINLTVSPPPPPDFSLAASPASVAVTQGANTNTTINVARLNGFTGAVALSASGLPAGVTAGFNPASVTGTGSTLTFTASATAATGPATVTVTGTSGTLTHTVSISLTVNTAGGGETGGVTVTPVVAQSTPWFNEQDIRLNNTGPLTSLSITIVIQRTTGISFNGQYNTVGGQIQQSATSTASTITYQFTLTPGQTLGTGTKLFAAQTNGAGTAHSMAGDTFTVTYTTGGASFTQTGHF